MRNATTYHAVRGIFAGFLAIACAFWGAHFCGEQERTTASALSQLKIRVAEFGQFGDSPWHKEVCHAEGLCSSTDGSRAE
jgi:hypothetical protein